MGPRVQYTGWQAVTPSDTKMHDTALMDGQELTTWLTRGEGVRVNIWLNELI